MPSASGSIMESGMSGFRSLIQNPFSLGLILILCDRAVVAGLFEVDQFLSASWPGRQSSFLAAANRPRTT